MKYISLLLISTVLFVISSCGNNGSNDKPNIQVNTTEAPIEVENFLESKSEVINKNGVLELKAGDWLAYEIEVPTTGRYQVEVNMSAAGDGKVWLEDYYKNEDGRTYDITGNIKAKSDSELQSSFIDGSPLRAGLHDIKLRVDGGDVSVDWFKLTLMKEHIETKEVFTQKMDGETWNLVWSDEFDGEGLPDTTKWSYKVGNWGWGNHEPQYYTENRVENARQENGTLIIVDFC
jgi:hypothetical protein